MFTPGRLSLARKRRRLTKKGLAKALGVTPHTVLRYESGDITPPDEVATKIAKVLFFIAPGCSACPEEAAKLEGELNRIGLKYQIEGVFVGDPPQIGKYLAALRTYPFKFEIALDMDGKMTKQHGVKTFPSAVIEVDGKKFVITKAAELEAKLK